MGVAALAVWLLGCLALAARPPDDASALVQSAASARDQQHLQQRPRRYPHGAVQLQHTHSQGEPGCRLDFNVSHGCVDCPFLWGDKVDLKWVAHIKNGLHHGDKLTGTVQASFKNLNPDNLFTIVFSEKLTGEGKCGICDGTCKLTFRPAAGGIIDAVFPTMVWEKQYCNLGTSRPKGDVEDVVLVDSPIAVPNFWHAKPPVADVDFKFTISRANGQPRGSGGVRMNWRSAEELYGKPGMLAQLSAEGVGEAQALAGPSFAEGGGEAKGTLDGLPGLLRKYFEDTASMFFQGLSGSEPAGAAGEASMLANLNLMGSKTKERGLLEKHLVSNVFFRALDGSFTIADKYCTKHDKIGSVTCKRPFDSTSKFSIAFKLRADLKEGSRFRMNLQPRAAGVLGKLVESAYKTGGAPPVDVALCGRPAVYKFKEETFNVQMGKCGFHELTIELPSRVWHLPPIETVNLKQVPGIPMILAGTSISSLPNFAFKIHAEILNEDLTPQLDVDIELGVTDVA